MNKENREAHYTENIENIMTTSPKTDILETKNEITIFAEMPGVDDKGVNVSFENNIIKLSGKKTLPHFSENYKVAREEIVNGIYEKSFSILSDINVNGISALIKDGILKVILPKSEKAKPRRIDVTVE